MIWKTYTIAETPRPGKPTRRGVPTMGPSGAGIWSSPTLDPEHSAVYVNTGDNYSDPPTATSDAVLALSMSTGRLLWSKQMTEGDAYQSFCPLPDKASCPDSDGPDHDFGASPILLRLAGGRRALILPQKSGVLHAVDPDTSAGFEEPNKLFAHLSLAIPPDGVRTEPKKPIATLRPEHPRRPPKTRQPPERESAEREPAESVK